LRGSQNNGAQHRENCHVPNDLAYVMPVHVSISQTAVGL